MSKWKDGKILAKLFVGVMIKEYRIFETTEDIRDWVEKNYSKSELEELNNLYYSESTFGYCGKDVSRGMICQ